MTLAFPPMHFHGTHGNKSFSSLHTPHCLTAFQGPHTTVTYGAYGERRSVDKEVREDDAALVHVNRRHWNVTRPYHLRSMLDEGEGGHKTMTLDADDVKQAITGQNSFIPFFPISVGN